MYVCMYVCSLQIYICIIYSYLMTVFQIHGPSLVSNWKLTLNVELEKMWVEAIVSHFKTNFEHSPLGTEENGEQISVTFPGRESKPGPFEYEVRVDVQMCVCVCLELCVHMCMRT
jgi:hypothetical protein